MVYIGAWAALRKAGNSTAYLSIVIVHATLVTGTTVVNDVRRGDCVRVACPKARRPPAIINSLEGHSLEPRLSGRLSRA